MATRLGTPQTFERIERRRYPWHEWAAEPFATWLLVPNDDFDVDPKPMAATLHHHAERHGLRVRVNIDDPRNQCRIMFCFFKHGELAPVVSFQDEAVA